MQRASPPSKEDMDPGRWINFMPNSTSAKLNHAVALSLTDPFADQLINRPSTRLLFIKLPEQEANPGV